MEAIGFQKQVGLQNNYHPGGTLQISLKPGVIVGSENFLSVLRSERFAYSRKGCTKDVKGDLK